MNCQTTYASLILSENLNFLLHFVAPNLLKRTGLDLALLNAAGRMQCNCKNSLASYEEEVMCYCSPMSIKRPSILFFSACSPWELKHSSFCVLLVTTLSSITSVGTTTLFFPTERALRRSRNLAARRRPRHVKSGRKQLTQNRDIVCARVG